MKMAAIGRVLLCFVFSLSIFPQANAQQGKLISGEFKGISFARFAQQIEDKTDFHFYFNAGQVDSIRVDISVENKTLPAILDQIFQNTEMHYAIDADDHVFISRKFRIETILPDDVRSNQQADVLNDSVQTDYLDEEEKNNEKIKASLENRLFSVGNPSTTTKSGTASIAGYVRDSKTGEAIVGAAIYLDNPPIGVTTDQYGYYSFTLPKGRHVIKITSVGMKETRRQVMLYSDGKLNIELQEFVPSLKAVTVVSEKNSNIKSLQMGVERLNIRSIKQVPVVFGEADVLRTVLSLPGVTSVGEGSTGLNVRGGASDQNLILLNDATIYNPSHLFGFFSAFNPDIIKDVELYKSSIPERFGGRLASVLDMTTIDGNKKKLSGAGGVGPLMARLTLDGPIGSEKTTFILGGRTTYSDWLLKTIPNPDYSNSSAFFYDANLRITHEINAKNSLYLSGYISQDKFRLNNDTLYQYSNRNLNIKWKHIFNNKLSGTLTGAYDSYGYSISSTANPVNAFDLKFGLNQSSVKAGFIYSPNTSHSVDFGLQSVYYQIQPGSYQPFGVKSLVVPDQVQKEQGLESALYLGDKYSISSAFSIEAGIRYSMFNYLGTHDVFQYMAGQPRTVSTLIDTVHYGKNAVIKTYQGPEYRISGRFSIDENSSIKAGYNTLRQYINVLSNTTSISPIDIWKLADPNIKPQTGEQFSLGYYHNLKSNTIETSVEVYYKRLHNYLDYKDGAQLVLNHHIETDVLETRGKAYGAEFMIKKTTGKLNGWLSYTYSRVLLQVDDPLAGQTINNGQYYPANFDKPHNVNFVGNYKVSHRLSFSVNVSYSTGRPITLPVAIYYLAGSQRVYYSERNLYRVPDYFRTDFSMNIEGNHKIKKFKHSSWTLGVYNLTGRKNPYSIYFVEENGVIKGYKLSIFGTAIPFITYNFKF